MDSLTQIVLGAATAEAVAGRKIGNKAILIGALAGTIPDLDVIPAEMFMNTVDGLLFHRGFTHSILFCLLIPPLLAWLAKKLQRPKKTQNHLDFKEWYWLFFFCFFTHILLDCFTAWGTSVLWPLDYRLTFKSIFVVDPLYTIPLLISLVVLMFFNRSSSIRLNTLKIGLGISSCYLLFTLINKQMVNAVFEKSMQSQQFKWERYESKPGPLNNILWAMNAEKNDSIFIGYYSHFDDNKEVKLFGFAKHAERLEPYQHYQEIKCLRHLSEDYFTVDHFNLQDCKKEDSLAIQKLAQKRGYELADSGIRINDLRFGLADGWLEGTGEFVFSYVLIPDLNSDNILVHNTIRNPEEGLKMLSVLWDRILGKEHPPD